MNLLVKRRKSDGVATLGEMFIAGVHECYTLEPPQPILAGTYEVIINMSQRFQRLMPLLLNVPGHTGIRIHWGNWRKDTEDCLLVGETQGKDFIGYSVDEFNKLFVKLQEALAEGPVYITYEDCDEVDPTQSAAV
jgi:hypothetical protein